MACTFAIGGELGCATYKDCDQCGKSTGPFTAETQQGQATSVSATLAATASSEDSGTHTVTTKTIFLTPVGLTDMPGLTGDICVRLRKAKFTLEKWKKEVKCSFSGNGRRGKKSTYIRWVPTGTTEVHEVVIGHCKHDKTKPCTLCTKSPTVSFVALSLYLIYLLELTSHN